MLAAGEQLALWELRAPVLPREKRSPAGAGAVVLAGPAITAPLNGILLLQAGDFLDCWVLDRRVRPLDPLTLAAVQDDTSLPFAHPDSPQAVHEGAALHDTLVAVLRSPARAFSRAADWTVSAELLTQRPQDYRGTIVRLDGQVRRIRRLEVGPEVLPSGARDLYLIQVATRVKGVPRLFCLLSPGLPPGLKVAEYPREGPFVTAAGYLFKRYRLGQDELVGGYPDRSVLLLVGHALPVILPEVRARAAAAALPGSGGPGVSQGLAPLTFLLAGEQAGLWVVEDPTRPPSLNPEYLAAVRDRTRIASGLDGTDQDVLEEFAYYDAVIKASRTPASVFLRAVEPHVTYAHLFNEPDRYRGRVVRIEGELVRVRQYEPRFMEEHGGVQNVYEVWLLNDEFGRDNPACLICPALPPGIKVAEQVKKPVRVAFVGYFFKRYRYKSEDARKANEFRDVPLLIGRLVVEPRPKSTAKPPPAWTDKLLPVFFAVIIGSFSLIFLLAWAFRRADARVRTRLDAASWSPADLEAPGPGDQTPPAGEERK